MSNSKVNSLQVLDSLEIGPVLIDKRKITAAYTVRAGRKSDTMDLVYKYDEDVFNAGDESDVNLASMILAQVALNYALFCKKIIFKGIYDQLDRKALSDWAEIAAREIIVHKLMYPNPFLTGDFRKNIPTAYSKDHLADFIFEEDNSKRHHFEWQHSSTDADKHCVLSSGGKDSLLSYALSNELGYETHPIFINESGRHWFTALNAHKYFRDNVNNTARVWVNSDRIFSFMLKNMPFIRKDFSNVRSDEYPIRLWTVAVFSFGVLPLMRKRNIGRMIIGDEYDTTVKAQHEGITHYNGLYDQSRYFDDAMSRYFFRKGWSISQFSVLRPLSELLIEKILSKRYPHLLKLQMSCHAAHKEDEKIKPCGKCEKCRRIVGMLTALDEDPHHCGYTDAQIDYCIGKLNTKSVHQEKDGVSQLMFMLHRKGIINPGDEELKSIKEHPEILHLRFDKERSPMNGIPLDLRNRLYRIYLEYAVGSKKRLSRKWVDINPFEDPEINTPYPFEFSFPDNGSDKSMSEHDSSTGYLWANLTWPEAEKRMKITDIAILPVGALEQHGPHLPLDVDAFDAEYLSHKVAEACSEPKPLVLPLISYGVSYHHEDFAGTVSISNESLSKMVYEIGMSVAKNGIKKLLIINGHGDNSPTLNFAAQMINRDSKIFVAVDSGETSDVDLDGLIDTPNDVHAGEIETSTTLAIRPGHVKMDFAEQGVLKFSNRYLNFSSSRGIPWYSRTKKFSNSGVIGDPTKANPEKGIRMWEIMIAHLVTFIEDLKKMKIENIYQKKY